MHPFHIVIIRASHLYRESPPRAVICTRDHCKIQNHTTLTGNKSLERRFAVQKLAKSTIFRFFSLVIIVQPKMEIQNHLIHYFYDMWFLIFHTSETERNKTETKKNRIKIKSFITTRLYLTFTSLILLSLL
jgi:hypothetical protein